MPTACCVCERGVGGHWHTPPFHPTCATSLLRQLSVPRPPQRFFHAYFFKINVCVIIDKPCLLLFISVKEAPGKSVLLCNKGNGCNLLLLTMYTTQSGSEVNWQRITKWKQNDLKLTSNFTNYCYSFTSDCVLYLPV